MGWGCEGKGTHVVTLCINCWALWMPFCDCTAWMIACFMAADSSGVGGASVEDAEEEVEGEEEKGEDEDVEDVLGEESGDVEEGDDEEDEEPKGFGNEMPILMCLGGGRRQRTEIEAYYDIFKALSVLLCGALSFGWINSVTSLVTVINLGKRI